MKQEYKELLFKDLCARAPHGVICQFVWTYSNETTDGEDAIAKENDSIRCIDTQTKEILSDYYGEWVDLEHCKPYLRQISSMTKEEYKEMQMVLGRGEFAELMNKTNGLELWLESVDTDPTIWFDSLVNVQDWLNKKMFAYRTIGGKDMFELGLALEAPEGMYK